MQTDPRKQARGVLLVTWRGWPFAGKNKQQGQQNSRGVTESGSWRGGGPDANPPWQLLRCKVWLCQAGMSFYTHTHARARPHVQRPRCNPRQTRYNIPYQPERYFTRRTRLNEGRAAKMNKRAQTGDWRPSTRVEKKNKTSTTLSHFGFWLAPSVHLLNLR